MSRFLLLSLHNVSFIFWLMIVTVTHATQFHILHILIQTQHETLLRNTCTTSIRNE